MLLALKLPKDNTKEVEERVQKTLRGMKEEIGETAYQKIYPSGSNPGRFYGMAKVHKLKPEDEDKVNRLPIRPIISNIGTATHKTAKYLCDLLSPLGKSEYTVESTKEFINRIKGTRVPEGYVMISFDVVSLFTNVPLQRTIDIILHKVYTEKKIKTKIPRSKMKELLLLCTQEVPFTFNGESYMQVDGVMMGSPLGALFANIFMCELENTIIPELGNTIKSWTRYVDDTFAYIKPEKVEEITMKLNEFHQNIKFTSELEADRKLPFLDVLIQVNNDSKIETSVYRKKTNTDIYMNWFSYAPFSWKVATLKSLVKRAFLISSKTQFLDAELEHITETFTKKNDYPNRLVQEIIRNERLLNVETTNIRTPDETENAGAEEQEEKPDQLSLNLPYAGKKGEELVKKVKKYISNSINKEKKLVSMQATYRARRLGSNFNIKDKISFENQHNVVYHAKCPNRRCKSHYNGQTKCRI